MGDDAARLEVQRGGQFRKLGASVFIYSEQDINRPGEPSISPARLAHFELSNLIRGSDPISRTRIGSWPTVSPDCLIRVATSAAGATTEAALSTCSLMPMSAGFSFRIPLTCLIQASVKTPRLFAVSKVVASDKIRIPHFGYEAECTRAIMFAKPIRHCRNSPGR